MDIRRFFKRQRVSDEGLSSCPAEDSNVTRDSVAPLHQNDADFHQRTVAEVVDSMEETPSSVSSRDVVSHDDSPSPSFGLNCDGVTAGYPQHLLISVAGSLLRKMRHHPQVCEASTPCRQKLSRELRGKFGVVCMAMGMTNKSLKTVCPSRSDEAKEMKCEKLKTHFIA
ncbi:hypothetical protein HPB50_023483 [Hyalomma asiaticum]|uniref:Uncharacterized protein n=1 Tax=Hyalomma asiaticum TaxID=266040 RepID=A0ACB7SEZ1_HYAAI|nr:hypothetical protein HPB50_023483 [Hyalomma asiaticum]